MLGLNIKQNEIKLPSASKIVDLIYYTLRGKKPKEKENSDKNKSYLFA